MVNCDEIKSLIPGYIKHSVEEEDAKKIEEHLCVCEQCRKHLAVYMDKIEHPEKSAEKETQTEPATIQDTTSSHEEISQNNPQIISKPKKTIPLEYIILGIGILVLIVLIGLILKSS